MAIPLPCLLSPHILRPAGLLLPLFPLQDTRKLSAKQRRSMAFSNIWDVKSLGTGDPRLLLRGHEGGAGIVRVVLEHHRAQLGLQAHAGIAGIGKQPAGHLHMVAALIGAPPR